MTTNAPNAKPTAPATPAVQSAQTASDAGTMVKPGIYKGRGVAGSEQYGVTDNNKPELNIKLSVPALNRQLTTVLYLSPEAYRYSMERLRSLGCTGNIEGGDLTGIDSKDVDVEVTYEQFEGKMRMRVQIMGGGTFNVKNPTTKEDFWARVRALNATGSGGGGTAGEPPPDF